MQSGRATQDRLAHTEAHLCVSLGYEGGAATGRADANGPLRHYNHHAVRALGPFDATHRNRHVEPKNDGFCQVWATRWQRVGGGTPTRCKKSLVRKTNERYKLCRREDLQLPGGVSLTR